MGKKELIVASTKKMILLKGYKKLLVEDITSDAGIAKGSFYTYFKSKNLVIDYILEKKIVDIENSFIINKQISLKEFIKETVTQRIILDDEKIKDELILVNLFRNVASLEDSTLLLLKRIEFLMIERMKKIIFYYSKDIKIAKEDIDFYAKMLNNIIANFKTFDLFFCKKTNTFIKDIDDIKRKYQTKELEKAINIISESILKILTY
ncbi:TetR/AcrR family transcriptional regulator [uncultured Fusobacterium sp.]|uniref:TetR/AcrR family transcriptional regulator n=1 Tax=uncultured Fusobacterium sp. TaxID=159267 RepID=UPI0025D53C71|nr:TetR/AcrR family transcriptional regulator [uncultured Fusobacterium sp.]